MNEKLNLESEKHPYIYDPLWAEVLRRFIKSEKAKSGLTYAQISEKLKHTFNTIQSADNLKSKIARANFGTQLFLQLLIVLGSKTIAVNDINALYQSLKAQEKK